MADPMTELAKEFLELNNYLVRKDTKFYKKKNQEGTAGDVDIIATRPNRLVLGDREFGSNIVGEAKQGVYDKESEIDYVYEDKFKCIDNSEICRPQLERYLPEWKFDRVLFCFAARKRACDYAWNEYKLKVVTAGFIIKQFAHHFNAKSEKSWTYYPEWYNYSLIRIIMSDLEPSEKFTDQLMLEDFVSLDPVKNPNLRNRFVDINQNLFREFVMRQNSSEVAGDIIDYVSSEWTSWFVDRLQKNKELWKAIARRLDKQRS